VFASSIPRQSRKPVLEVAIQTKEMLIPPLVHLVGSFFNNAVN